MADGSQGAVLRTMSAHLPPPPPGMRSPEEWGDEAIARERLAPHAAEVHAEVRTLRWHFPEGVDGWLAMMDESAPPVVAARRAIGEDRWPAVRKELREGILPAGEVDADGGFVLEPRYLVITARARGGEPASRS